MAGHSEQFAESAALFLPRPNAGAAPLIFTVSNQALGKGTAFLVVFSVLCAEQAGSCHKLAMLVRLCCEGWVLVSLQSSQALSMPWGLYQPLERCIRRV